MEDFRQNIRLHEELERSLKSALSTKEWDTLLPLIPGILNAVGRLLLEDLTAYTLRDPASNGRSDIILSSYSSFKAILFYRLAHRVWHLDKVPWQQREIIAHKLSNKGKLLSGVEIHPAAKVGRRFVIDHGYGTVIGETCEVGDDCYILNGVILGAIGIADNPGGPRHPRIGNNVEIGAGVKVFGSVVIGDNVFLSPSCIILRDVPARASVYIVNQLQMEHSAGAKSGGLFSAYTLHDRLYLIGGEAGQFEVSLLDTDYLRLPGVELELTLSEGSHSQYRIICKRPISCETKYPLNLLISSASRVITLIDPPGLSILVRHAQATNQLKTRAS